MEENQIEKKVPLLLPYVIELETDREVSVKDRLKDDYTYVCPFCRKEVSRKEGEKRRHHFFHLQSDNPCNPTNESIEHESAKYFIFNALNNKESFNITIKDLSLLSDQERLIFEKLGLTNITIKSDQIPATQYNNHIIEKPVNQYEIKYEDREISNRRPDIFSEDNGKIFAWEVFVTHAVDEEKKIYYKNEKIPYIELEPIKFDKNYISFEFELKSYNGFAFSLLRESVYDNLIEHHRSEIFEIYREKIGEQVFKNIKEKAYTEINEKIKNEYEEKTKRVLNEYEEKSKLLQIEKDKIWNFWILHREENSLKLQENFEEKTRKIQNKNQDIISDSIKDYKNRIINKLKNTDIEKIIRKALGTTIKLKYVSTPSKNYISKLCRFKKAEIINENKSNKNIKIIVVDKEENKYGLDKHQYESLLNEFSEKFHNKNRLMFLLDKSNKIIGFEVVNNNEPKLSWHCSESEIYKSIEIDNIKLAIRLDDGNIPYMIEGKNHITYFKTELVLEQIIINLLNQLNKKFDCWITINKGFDNNSAFVSEFWFRITDEDYLINTIKNTIMNLIDE